MKDRDFILVRYSSLTAIWSHQNTVLLQWPSIVITTVLVVLSILIPNQLKSLLNINCWGKDYDAIYGVGIPLLLLGVGICSIVYLMGRAKKVLILVEQEILNIEKNFESISTSFSKLNHPQGLSGIRLVRLYLVACLAIPIVVLGFLISLGIFYGVIFSMTYFIVCFLIILTQTTKRLCK